MSLPALSVTLEIVVEMQRATTRSGWQGKPCHPDFYLSLSISC